MEESSLGPIVVPAEQYQSGDACGNRYNFEAPGDVTEFSIPVTVVARTMGINIMSGILQQRRMLSGSLFTHGERI